MPQVAAFAATAIAKVIVGYSALKATTLGAFAIKAVTLTALSAVSAAMTPQVGAGGSPRQGLPDTNAPVHIASGRFGASGRPVWRHETWGQDNRLWTQAIVLAGAGPIKSLQTFKLDDVTVPISSGVATGRYANALWMDTQLGAQPESGALAPPVLSEHGSPSGWGGNNKLSGKAAYMLTMVQNKDQNRFVGPLNPIWTGEGCYVYDPRLDSTYPGGSGACRIATPSTWVWSECPALHALKWALGHWEDPTGQGAPGVGTLVCGMGIKPAGIDFPSFVSLANVSDANGWKVSAYPSSEDSPKQVLDAYLQAAGAIYADVNGKLGCISRGASQTATITVTPADAVGPIEMDRQSSLMDRQNTLTPRFWSEDQDWQLVPLEPITDSAWVTEDDGDVRGDGLDLPFVPDKDQAGQITYLTLAHTREPVRGTMPLKPYMGSIQPGTRFVFDAPGSDVDALKCLCLRAGYDPKSKAWRVSFVSETDAKYTAAGSVAPTAPSPSTYDPPDRTDPDPPTTDDWTVTGGTVGNNGVTQPAVVITGASNNAYTREVVVRYKASADADWVDEVYPPTATQIVLTGLKPETAYDVAVSYRTTFDAASTELVFDPVTTGALVAGGLSDDSGNLLAGQEVVDSLTQIAADGEDLARAAFELASESASVREMIYNTSFVVVGGETVPVRAGYATEVALRAEGDTALASSISTLSATVDEQSASITEISDLVVDLDGVVSAMYGLTINVNGDITGFLVDGVAQAFTIVADEFRVTSPDGATVKVPMAIVGGKVRFNADVEIDGDLTIDGTITTAKVQQGAITPPYSYYGGTVSWSAPEDDEKTVATINDVEVIRGSVLIMARLEVVSFLPTSGVLSEMRLYRNGSEVTAAKVLAASTPTSPHQLQPLWTMLYMDTPGAGTHDYEITWEPGYTLAGGDTGQVIRPSLVIIVAEG